MKTRTPTTREAINLRRSRVDTLWCETVLSGSQIGELLHVAPAVVYRDIKALKLTKVDRPSRIYRHRSLEPTFDAPDVPTHDKALAAALAKALGVGS